MSVYPPPTDIGTIFNPANFGSADSEITTDYLNANYLKFPVAQGFETFVGTNNQATTDCQQVIDMNGNKITTCANPTASQDVATKFYVDGLVGNPNVVDTNTNATFFPTFVSGSGVQTVLADITSSPFTYNPSNNNFNVGTTLNLTQTNVAVGKNAGLTSQSSGGVAIGLNAGTTTQGSSSVAIGTSAGNNLQNVNSVAIGTGSGQFSQNANSVAIGNTAGQNTQGASSIAIGIQAGQTTQGSSSIAIGGNAGQTSQSGGAVAIGNGTGTTSQGTNSVALGAGAGASSQSASCVAIGSGAGATSQNANSVAIGVNAGNNTQSTNSVAVGVGSGQTTQGARSVAIGNICGTANQGADCVAIGNQAGRNNQATLSVAIGSSAGFENQQTECIAIGDNAGSNGQNARSIAIGQFAGQFGQQSDAIAIGDFAGLTIQSSGAVAIGKDAGRGVPAFPTITNRQGVNAVAIGTSAGRNTQGAGGVAIGLNAGQGTTSGQGVNSIAIGVNAGVASQTAGSICLNASGLALNPNQAGLFINPIRIETVSQIFTPKYNPTTFEVSMKLDEPYAVLEDFDYETPTTTILGNRIRFDETLVSGGNATYYRGAYNANILAGSLYRRGVIDLTTSATTNGRASILTDLDYSIANISKITFGLCPCGNEAPSVLPTLTGIPNLTQYFGITDAIFPSGNQTGDTIIWRQTSTGGIPASPAWKFIINNVEQFTLTLNGGNMTARWCRAGFTINYDNVSTAQVQGFWTDLSTGNTELTGTYTITAGTGFPNPLTNTNTIGICASTFTTNATRKDIAIDYVELQQQNLYRIGGATDITGR